MTGSPAGSLRKMKHAVSGSGLADQALEALREWPARTECRIGSAGAGLGLADGSRQIIHLHQSDEAELYLTWPAIVRLSPALAAVSPVRFTAGDAWVRIRLDATPPAPGSPVC